MKKKTQESHDFMTVTGSQSTRMSARGFGTIQPMILEADSSFTDYINGSIQTLLLVSEAYKRSISVGDVETANNALCQINQQRGALGAIKTMFHNQKNWPNSELFMNYARMLLPSDTFDFIMSHVRATRELHADALLVEIEEVMKKTKPKKFVVGAESE